MQTITISQIAEQLHRLSSDKLVVVYDFVSYLIEREIGWVLREAASKTYQTMLASEAFLRQDWDRPEEDAAWANL